MLSIIEEARQELNREIKQHPISVLAYVTGIGYFLLFIICATVCFREKAALPDYLVSGLLLTIAGYTLFNIMVKISASIKENEEKKQQPPQT